MVTSLPELVMTLSAVRLGAVSPVHTLSAMSAILMSGVVIVALLTKPVGRVMRLVSWASIALCRVYAFNAYVLFRYGE